MDHVMMTIRTISGRRIDLERPRPEDIDIGDIARGLSHCCRFAGQLPRFYSVAQHSVLVASLCPEHLRLAGLLHDATEAYMGDLSRNLKHSRYLSGYRELEQRLDHFICLRFGIGPIPSDLRQQVKWADDLAACFEHACLREGHWYGLDHLRRLVTEGFIQGDVEKMRPLLEQLPYSWYHWDPKEAEMAFLDHFEAYHSTKEMIR